MWQMRGEKLGVEQDETAAAQSLHQLHQRHFGSIADAAEHALAEKSRAQRDAVKPARQFAVLPAFHRMGMAAGMKRRVKAQDLVIDPALLAARRRRGAGPHHIAESLVGGDPETAASDRARQTPAAHEKHPAE